MSRNNPALGSSTSQSNRLEPVTDRKSRVARVVLPVPPLPLTIEICIAPFRRGKVLSAGLFPTISSRSPFLQEVSGFFDVFALTLIPEFHSKAFSGFLGLRTEMWRNYALNVLV